MIKNINITEEAVKYFWRNVLITWAIHFTIVFVTTLIARSIIMTKGYETYYTTFSLLVTPFIIALVIYVLAGAFFYKDIQTKTYFAVFSLFCLLMLVFALNYLVFKEDYEYTNLALTSFVAVMLKTDLVSYPIITSIIPPLLISLGIFIRSKVAEVCRC